MTAPSEPLPDALELIAPPDVLQALRALPDAISGASRLLSAGLIVAVKGPTGFYLVCDATSREAVGRLRQRLARPDRPFTVLLPTLEAVRAHCLVNGEEARLLAAPHAPVVLLHRRSDSTLASNIAPGDAIQGVMLPPSPALARLAGQASGPLAITGGHPPDQPIVIDNAGVRAALEGVADAFLLYHQPIAVPADESVWWVDEFAEAFDPLAQPARRGRGDAPYRVRLPRPAQRVILGLGGESRVTFCLVHGSEAVISTHLGDVKTLDAVDGLRSALAALCRDLGVAPEVIAHDLNPNYRTTRLARLMADGPQHTLVGVAHAHAHIAACLADRGRVDRVIGIALDGAGMGSDGRIGGGEVLIVEPAECQRVAILEPLPLPVGEPDVPRPYRVAWAYLLAAQGSIPELYTLSRFPAEERQIVAAAVERGAGPSGSSTGRLFDAVAALTGVCASASYEAQAAIALEQAARRTDVDAAPAYPFTIDSQGVIHIKEMLGALVRDVQNGRKPEHVAASFHRTLVALFVEAASQAGARTGIKTVALSGGVFQNRLLLRLMRQGLRERGFEVLTHRDVPPNDGGLSLGQAFVALFQAHAQPR